MKDKLLFKLDKSADLQLKVTLQEYKGVLLIDVRFYYLNYRTGEYRPSTQGIALTSPDLIEELVKVLPKAAKELEKVVLARN